MRSRDTFLVLLGILFLTIGLLSTFGYYQAIPRVHATSRTIMLRGGYASGWNGTNPGPTISVTQGDTITINLVSSDGAPHTFVIDVAHAGIISTPNCSMDKCSSQFSSATTFTFTADMAIGTYTYYCSIHLQHMYGTIKVQANAGESSITGSTPPGSTSSGSTSMPPTYGGGGSSSRAPVIGAVALIVVAVIATTALLLRRRAQA